MRFTGLSSSYHEMGVDSSMFNARIVRTLVHGVLLGFVSVVLGCSGGETAAVTDPAGKEAENKKIAEQTRAEKKEEAADRREQMRRDRGGR